MYRTTGDKNDEHIKQYLHCQCPLESAMRYCLHVTDSGWRTAIALKVHIYFRSFTKRSLHTNKQQQKKESNWNNNACLRWEKKESKLFMTRMKASTPKICIFCPTEFFAVVITFYAFLFFKKNYFSNNENRLISKPCTHTRISAGCNKNVHRYT